MRSHVHTSSGSMMADGCDTAGNVCVAHTSFLLIMAPLCHLTQPRDSGHERSLVIFIEQAHPHGVCDALTLVRAQFLASVAYTASCSTVSHVSRLAICLDTQSRTK